MPHSLGQKLRSLRRERKLTLQRLGQLTGLSSGLLSRYETGRDNNPSLETLLRLARSLEVHPAVFFPGPLPPPDLTLEEKPENAGLEAFVEERREAGKRVDESLVRLLRDLASASSDPQDPDRPKEVWAWLYRALEAGLHMRE